MCNLGGFMKKLLGIFLIVLGLVQGLDAASRRPAKRSRGEGGAGVVDLTGEDEATWACRFCRYSANGSDQEVCQVCSRVRAWREGFCYICLESVDPTVGDYRRFASVQCGCFTHMHASCLYQWLHIGTQCPKCGSATDPMCPGFARDSDAKQAEIVGHLCAVEAGKIANDTGGAGYLMAKLGSAASAVADWAGSWFGGAGAGSKK